MGEVVRVPYPNGGAPRSIPCDPSVRTTRNDLRLRPLMKVHSNAPAAKGDAFYLEAETLLRPLRTGERDPTARADDAVPRQVLAIPKRPHGEARRAGPTARRCDLTVRDDLPAGDPRDHPAQPGEHGPAVIASSIPQPAHRSSPVSRPLQGLYGPRNRSRPAMSDPVVSKTMDVAGGTISYEEIGRGRPIVFLHEGIADRRMWDREFSRFGRDHRVVRYDLRGYGGSPPATSEFSPVSDLLTLLDRLDVTRPLIVGPSVGGRIALDLALAFPDRVGALLLIAPGYSGMDYDHVPGGKATFERDEALSKAATDAWTAGKVDEAIEQLRHLWASALRGESRQLFERMVRDNAREVFEERSGQHETRGGAPAASRLATTGVLACTTSYCSRRRSDGRCNANRYSANEPFPWTSFRIFTDCPARARAWPYSKMIRSTAP